MTRDIIAYEVVHDEDILVVRGQRVILDARVAEAFGTETRRVNEAVSRNREKFNEAHCFQVTEAEAARLRSQAAISKASDGGRGGARYLPHVFTIKGVARLATVLSTPAALRATDLIIDTFLVVHEQLKRGRRTVSIPEPSRFVLSEEQRQEMAKLRAKLAASLSKLLDTIVDVEGEQSLKQVSRAIGSKALASIQERLRSKGLENSKLEADTSLVLAQAEKMLAEARKVSSEADGIDIGNFERRIGAVKKIAELMKELEPDQLIGLIDQFDGDAVRIAGPKERS